MATPSVLTVPSMYGDGILYSGPSAYGSELAVQPVDLQVDFQAAPSGGVIVDANTFTTSSGGLEGIRSKDAAFTLPVGTAFEIEIRGTTTSNGITLGNFGGSGNEYGSGFGVHRFVSLNNRLWIRQNSAGTTTITYLSIRPLTQGSDFDFTRATTGTRINEDGYIEDVPYNLLSYTEELTAGYWNKISVTVEAQPDIIDPKNGRGVFKVTDTSGGGTAYLHVPSIANANYGRSIYARTVSGTGTISLLSYYGNTNNLFTLTEQWQRFYVDSVTTATGQINFYAVDFRAGDLTEVLLYAPQMTKSPDLKPYLPTTDRANLPRLNYPIYGGCPSLLVEPQRTNLVINSNNADSVAGNYVVNLQINSSNNLSPEGINNAQEIEATATYQPRVESVVTLNTTVYSVSCYVKKVTGDFFGLGFYQQDIGNQFAKFDLNTGTFVAVSSNGAISQSATNIYNCKIIAHKNNWYRITCNILTGSAVSKSNIKWLAMTAGTSAASFSTGNVGDKFLIYGRQVEQADYTTSYIPTSGSTVTRNEDKALYAGLGTTDTFNDDEGVLFIETEALFNNTDPRGININAGNGNNRVLIAYPSSASSTILGYTQSTAGSGSSMSAVGIDTTQKHKVAIKYELNNTSFWVDGVRRGLDTSVAMPVGLKQLDFSNGIGTGVAEYRGNLNAIAVYKTALTDTELANLTSYNNHDLFIPYRSRMQMIGADQELQCTEHDITRFL